MFHGANFEPVAAVEKSNAIVAHSRSIFWRIDILKPLYIAFGSLSEVAERVENPQGSGLINRAKLCFGSIAPLDPLAHCYRPLS